VCDGGALSPDGQVASLQRQLGHTPPNTGFRTGFLDERGLYGTV
jgi:hypothetical protein